MTLEEAEQFALAEIAEVSQQQTLSTTQRITHITSVVHRLHIMVLSSLLTSKTNYVVPHGPFAGMRCMGVSAVSTILPRLIGSYEAELHDTIREFALRGYRRVVNVGCGEGYYAVGLARLLPTAQVLALDPDPVARSLCQSLAELNGVANRVTTMDKCTPANLPGLALPGTMIFCDCEGDEIELLDPVAAPTLAQCDILVEMHDFLRPDTSATLVNRFRSTHTIYVIPQSSRDPQAYPILESFSEYDRMFSLCELRPGPTPWGLFLSNTHARTKSA